MAQKKCNSSEKSAEKEKAIISAARARFALYGFSKVSMEEIATDVGMGKASLYYYFPTKESVFQAVIIQEMNEFLDETDKILNSDFTASEKLVELVKNRFVFIQKFLNLGALTVYSFHDPKSIYKKYLGIFEEKELEFTHKVIKEGQNNGEFEENIDPKAGITLVHTLHGLRVRAIKRYTLPPGTNFPKAINELQEEMNILIKIFIKGISK
jgi:TetR/AcrR family transcriptional repressor of mexJK operon